MFRSSVIFASTAALSFGERQAYRLGMQSQTSPGSRCAHARVTIHILLNIDLVMPGLLLISIKMSTPS